MFNIYVFVAQHEFVIMEEGKKFLLEIKIIILFILFYNKYPNALSSTKLFDESDVNFLYEKLFTASSRMSLSL